MPTSVLISTLSSDTIKQRFYENQIEHIRFFGSYAKGLENSSSDVDILYQTNRSLTDNAGFFGFYKLMPDIKESLGKDSDFVSVDALDPLIRDEILSTRI